MYARVASFEGWDVEQADMAANVIRERFMPEIKALAGYAGYLALSDREAGRGVGIVLFDSEESLREGDRALDAMSPPTDFGTVRRTSRELYEVVTHEGGSDARAARVSRLEGPADKIDEGTRYAQEKILPGARQIEGWRGVLALADRASGKQALVTLWDSREAMQASEERANALRSQSAEASDQQITGVERYEVILSDVPVGATR
jgi:heme-degrading monooxygenase HmoA